MARTKLTGIKCRDFRGVSLENGLLRIRAVNRRDVVILGRYVARMGSRWDA